MQHEGKKQVTYLTYKLGHGIIFFTVKINSNFNKGEDKMITLVKMKKGFDKAWQYLKKKDEIAIKKVERRFKSSDKNSGDFVRKVYDVYEAYKLQVPHIATVLEDYLDNPIWEIWLDKPFSKAEVCSVLLDMQFVATLMCTSLLRRTANLERKSEGQRKLRIYIAILNYDRYKKSQVVKKQSGKVKGRKTSVK